MNRAAFVIRFCYDESVAEEEFQWRLAWLREQVLPRIAAQTVAADTWLWVHPRHRDLFPHTFTVEAPTGRLAIENRHPWRNVRGLPKYPVQLRLDSDDLIREDYVARALAELDRARGLSALAHFQPYKVDVRTGVTYWCAPAAGRGHYGPQKISAFCALRQDPTLPSYAWVYSVGHIKLWKIVSSRARLIEDGYCWAACHTYNDSTQVYSYDQPIGKIELEREG